MVMGELPRETQALVIGGGPGGYAAAFRAAELDLDVTLVSDEERLGGVCLLRGCIPSKALLEATELLSLAHEWGSRGIDFGDGSVHLDRLREWKESVVEQLAEGVAKLADARDIDIVHGRARFTGSHEARVAGQDGGATVSFEHAIIASGSLPVALPDTEFGERILSSAGALEIAGVPERLLVVGGGYVGLELGSVYAALGSRVTLVEMADGLMPGADPDLVEPLARRVRERFDAFHLETSVAGMHDTGERVKVQLSGEDVPETAEFDRVLVAVGRRPATEDLGLENTGVEHDDRGFITVDPRARTADPAIHAIGDAAGGMLLAHKAMHQGQAAAEDIVGRPAAFDARAVPAVVYTDPQIAWCGLTETAAAEQDLEVQVARFPWRAAGRALTKGAEDGITKLICEPGSGRVLGVGIAGRGAESLIAEGVLAVEMGAVAEDLSLAVAPHPTLSETLHEAAQLLLGSPTHLPPQRARASTA